MLSNRNNVHAGGIIKNSTRTPKNYTLDHLDLLGIYEEYFGSSRTFPEWITHKYYNFWQQCIYNGTNDPGSITQHFA